MSRPLLAVWFTCFLIDHRGERQNVHRWPWSRIIGRSMIFWQPHNRTSTKPPNRYKRVKISFDNQLTINRCCTCSSQQKLPPFEKYPFYEPFFFSSISGALAIARTEWVPKPNRQIRLSLNRAGVSIDERKWHTEGVWVEFREWAFMRRVLFRWLWGANAMSWGSGSAPVSDFTAFASSRHTRFWRSRSRLVPFETIWRRMLIELDWRESVLWMQWLWRRIKVGTPCSLKTAPSWR